MRAIDLSLALPFVVAACGTEASTTLAPPPPPMTTAPEPTTTSESLRECGAVERWVEPVRSYGLVPEPPRFSPDGTLVSRGRGVYFTSAAFLRWHDGRTVVAEGADYVSLDRTWAQAIERSNHTLRVVSVADGEEIAAFSDRVFDAALAPSGEHVYALESIPEDGSWHMTILGLSSGDTREVRIPNEANTAADRIVLATEDAAFLLGNRQILIVDRLTGEVRTSPELTAGDETLTGVVRSHDGSRLAVTTSAGTVRVVDAADFTDLEPPREGAPVRVNENIFAPLIVVTPAAWSSDGSMFAYVRADGALVVEDLAAGGAIVAEIAPRTVVPMAPVEGPALPVAVAFSPDDRHLAITYEYEVALVGCEVDGDEAELAVSLDAPAEARVDEVVTLRASHDLDRGIIGHRFSQDGAPIGVATANRTVEWRPREPGTFELAVEVDDGTHLGRASRSIIVRPE